MKRDPVNECVARREQLTDYLAGELTGEESEVLRRHLEDCEVCRALARELATTLDLARDALADPALAAELPDRLAPDRRTRIATPALGFRRARLWDRRWMMPAAAAAVVVVGFLTGLRWSGGPRSAPIGGSFAARTPPAVDLDRPDAAAMDAAADVSEDLRAGSPVHLAAARSSDTGDGEPAPAVAAAPVRPLRGTAGVLRGPVGGARLEVAETANSDTIVLSRAGADAGVGTPPATPPPAMAPPAPALLGQRSRVSAPEPTSLAARLSVIRIPVPDFEGLTARQAVERLNELATASPEANDLRIAWADAPSPELLASAREFLWKDAQGSGKGGREAAVRRLGRETRTDRAVPEETDAEREPMDREQRVSLLEAIRRLAEHYGLESRIEDGRVVFFERPANGAP